MMMPYPPHCFAAVVDIKLEGPPVVRTGNDMQPIGDRVIGHVLFSDRRQANAFLLRDPASALDH
jgi:hypothetical protein